jgi:hypothetical protein
VSNHFGQVGFLMRDREELLAVANRAIREGVRGDGGRGASLHRWDDASGAGCVVVVDEQGIQCAKPTFAGTPGATVRMGRWNEGKGDCAWCATLYVEVLEDGEMVYPALVEVADTEGVRRSVAPADVARASLVLFAEETGGPELWPELADRSAIPTGTFGNEPRARLALSGEVLRSELRTNALTGLPFGWARVASLAAEYDVLLPEPPPVGSTLRAGGWLFAALDVAIKPAEPPRARAGRRWFGRG